MNKENKIGNQVVNKKDIMIKKIIFSVLLLLILSIDVIFSKDAYAEFYVENYEINAELLSNGDLKIKEDIFYKTDEEKNGVYASFSTKKDSKKDYNMSDFELLNVLIDNKVAKQIEKGKNGDSNVYEYTYKDDITTLKVYSPFKKDIVKKITYDYIYKDIAGKYKDIAELYWNFMSKDIEEEISHFKLSLVLPEGSNEHDIYMYCHGISNVYINRNLEGTSIEQRTISLEIDEQMYRRDIDIRVLFDKDSLVNNKNNIDKEILLSIIEKEKLINEKILEFEEYNKDSRIVTILSIIVLFMAIYKKCKDKSKNKVTKENKYYTEIPDDENPALLSYYYHNGNRNLINIIFLELVRKGIFRIVNDYNEKGKEEEYLEYDETKLQIHELKKYEEILMNCIKEKMFLKDKNKKNNNNNTVIRVKYKEVEKRLKNDLNLYKEIQKVEKEVDKSAKQKYGEKKYKKFKDCRLEFACVLVSILIFFALLFLRQFVLKETDMTELINVSLIEVAMIIIFMFLIKFAANVGEIIGIVPIILSIVMAACGSEKIGFFTGFNITISLLALIIAFTTFEFDDKQKDFYEKMNGLKRYIKDVSLLNQKEIDHIILWDKYLIMASVFNFNDKIKKYLQLKASESADIETQYFASNYYRSFTISKSIGTAIAIASTNGISHSSGGSVVSSGGLGGGGFGGRGSGSF